MSTEQSSFMVAGIFDRIVEAEFVDQKTGKTIRRKSIVLVVDFSERKRDEVYVRIPETMEVPEFQKGEFYVIPFSYWSKEKVSFTARPDVQPR